MKTRFTVFLLIAALAALLLWPMAGRADVPMLEDFGYTNLASVHKLQAERRLLVVIAQFEDGTMAHTKDWYDHFIFDPTNQPRSVNGYFQEVSNGRFRWTHAGTVEIVVPAIDRYPTFLVGAGGNVPLADKLYSSNLVHRTMISGQVSFPQYDANTNGVVTADELTIVIISNDGGVGSRPTGPVQPPGSSVRWESNVALQDQRGDFATVCHELAHQLGALDLYSGGCDNWALTLMSCTGGTPPEDPSICHLDPWHKLQFGWTEPRIAVLPDGGLASIRAARRGSVDAPVILYDPDPARSPGEFFLLEYRDAGGYDANVAGNGLVIWHIRHDGNKMPLWLTDVAMTGNTQPDWSYCMNCKGLYYAAGAPSVCPAGGPHLPLPGVGDYRLSYNNPAAPGQSNWRFCSKCGGMYFGQNQGASVCPKGGTHSGISYDYVLNNSSTNYPYETPGWKWCSKCQGIFYGPEVTSSLCPAGSPHDGSLSGSYGLAQRMRRYTLAARAAPDLAYGGYNVWTNGTTTPELQWYDGGNTHIRVKVHPFSAGADSITVEWLGDLDTWVDFNFVGFPEVGTFDAPYNTFAEGVSNVSRGATLRIKTGHSPVTTSVGKPMRIEAYGGPVTLGR
jgi:M6 family metalloprotease-like protein